MIARLARPVLRALPRATTVSSRRTVGQVRMSHFTTRADTATKVDSLRHIGKLVGETVVANGWVRSVRRQKKVVFITLDDGSCMKELQVVADPAVVPQRYVRTDIC